MQTLGRNAQIFSLDYAISLIIVFLAIGLAINFFELQTISAQKNFEQRRLENIGQSAAQLLVSSPAISCEEVTVDGRHISFLPNCIGIVPASIQPQLGIRLTKANLGIPAEYDCNVSSTFDDTAVQQLFVDSGCNVEIDETANVFSTTRKVVIRSDDFRVSKEEFENCRTGQTCVFDSNELKLSVWRKTS